MAKPLTYFYDKECNRRVPLNEKGEIVLDWGETIPGQVKKREIWVKNESRDRIAFRQPYTLDEDLKIMDYPAKLFESEVGKVVIKFEPKGERIDALNANWGFDVIVG